MRAASSWQMAVAMAALALLDLSGCQNSKTREATFRQRGAAYLAQGNFEKARIELNNALQIDPKDPNARFMAGEAAEGLGFGRDAVSHYEAALEFDPANSGARARLSRLYVLAGVADKAMALAETGLKISPGDPTLLAVRGAARAQLGDAAGALSDAEEAVAAGPDEFVVALLSALYRQKGDSARAIAIAERGVEHAPQNIGLRLILADLLATQHRLDEAEAQLKQIISIDPGRFANRFGLAKFYIQQQNMDAAEKTLREAARVLPESREAKLALLDFLRTQRSPDQAEQEAQRLLAAQPDNDELRLDIAEFYEKTQRTDAATRLYQAVIEHAGLREHGLTARMRLARLRLAANDPEGAGKLIRDVMEEYPNDAEALYLHAQLAIVRNDVHTAITDLRVILRDSPSDVRAMRTMAHAHEVNGEPSLAEEMLRRAIDVNPGDSDTRLALIRLLTERGKSDDALRAAQEMVNDQPDNLNAARQLFTLLLARKDYAAARAIGAKAVDSPRTAATGHYLLGMLSEAEGHADQAAREYESTLKLQPRFGEALAAAVRLDLAENQSRRALDRLAENITADPNYVTAHNLTGEVLLSLKRPADAVVEFGIATRLSPEWWPPWRGLAIAQLELKQQDAAMDTLRRGVAATHGYSELALRLAALYEQARRTDEAIKVCDALLRREPGSYAGVSNLAMLLATYRTDKASLERAQQLADQLAGLSEPEALGTRGWVALKTGSYEEAARLLQQAADKLPDSPQLRYRLGLAQFKAGDNSAARRNLESAVSSGKPFLGLEEARATLNTIRQKSG